MPHDVELVEQDVGLRRVVLLERRVAKRLPHVHDGEADPLAALGSEPLVELVHALLGAILAAEPDGSLAFEIADDDAVGVTLADRHLVDADDLRSWGTGTPELLTHVLLLQLLDGVPVEVKLLGDILDGGGSAATPHVEGEALGVARIVGQPVELLALHLVAREAGDAAHDELEVDAPVAAREVANPMDLLIVEGPVPSSTDTTRRFFRRLRR